MSLGTRHETRADSARPREWKDPNELEVPAKLTAALKATGYETRWIRLVLDGKDDAKNVMLRNREGYEFVTRDEAEQNGWMDPPTYEHGKHGNLIIIGDLALAKMPVEIARSRDRQMAERTAALTRGINEQLSENARLNRLAPIQNDSTSRTTRGGERQVLVDKD